MFPKKFKEKSKDTFKKFCEWLKFENRSRCFAHWVYYCMLLLFVALYVYIAYFSFPPVLDFHLSDYLLAVFFTSLFIVPCILILKYFFRILKEKNNKYSLLYSLFSSWTLFSMIALPNRHLSTYAYPYFTRYCAILILLCSLCLLLLLLFRLLCMILKKIDIKIFLKEIYQSIYYFLPMLVFYCLTMIFAIFVKDILLRFELLH